MTSRYITLQLTRVLRQAWTLVLGADCFSPEMTPPKTIARFWRTAAAALGPARGVGGGDDAVPPAGGDAPGVGVLLAYTERSRETTRCVLEQAR